MFFFGFHRGLLLEVSRCLTLLKSRRVVSDRTMHVVVCDINALICNNLDAFILSTEISYRVG